jgi:diaminohydroxyphosphoribosylaminopyrimidine deaminase/5-amino-6-(5-phosphoribosylamino)uracil reductase
MTQQESIDEQYMRRCLQLALNGMRHAKPNPMVGAVIVSADGRIIGEGWHQRCGEGHAEVNAFASVRPEDESLLPGATIYVSLEPCSHYGKTPPCADLIVRKGVHRVVCGCIDPFAKVRGRGVERIRQAGISVTVGVLEKECLELNKRFITVQTHHRPFVTLKWAQTANGFIDEVGADGAHHTLQISTPYTQLLVHKMRAEADAIVIGRHTLLVDRPQLTTRLWSGPSPRRFVLTHHPEEVPDGFTAVADIPSLLSQLYEAQLQSLIVEGGAATLQAFIDAGAWDEARVETAPITVPAGTRAPHLPDTAQLASQRLPNGHLSKQLLVDGNTITLWRAR